MRFAVIGLNHGHIYQMVDGLLNVPGTEMVAFHAPEDDLREQFARRYPTVPWRERDAILEDESIDLICTAAINGHRGPLAVEAMRHGKSVFTDKPPVTSLEHLEAVEQAVAETGKLFFVLYGERLCSRADIRARELIQAGAIGRFVNFMGWGPHKLGIASRPAWMFDHSLYGGILCDIGIHQIELFHYLTGEKIVPIRSRVGNFNTPQYPEFEDFGDTYFQGELGTAGYARVDWFTPDASPIWGDVRGMFVGTEGTIEIRRTYNIAAKDASDTGPLMLLTTRDKAPHRVDCSDVPITWAEDIVRDVRDGVNRTTAHEGSFHAIRSILTMQRDAEKIRIRER